MKKKVKIETTKLTAYIVFRALFVIGAALAIVSKEWVNLALALFTLFLTFLPAIIEKRIKVDFPDELEIILLVFLFATLYLGSVASFYEMFWWWDILLHTLSGILFGAIGFFLVYILNKQKEINIHLNPLFIAIFAFSFAMTLGVLWELFEYFMDAAFGFNMLRSGLVDTIVDLIVNTVGAAFVAVLGYLYLMGKTNLFAKLSKRFVKNNPHLFKDNGSLRKKKSSRK